MKKVLIAVLAIGILAASTAMAGVVGSKHDLGNGSSTWDSSDTDQVCVFCHTPHQPGTTSIDPLWNHQTSSASYSVYDSTTLNANVSAFAGTDNSVSALCMSCHDGTIGVGNLYNAPGGGDPTLDTQSTLLTSGTAYLGTNLSNDHPVNFTYQNAIDNGDDGLQTPTSAAWVDAAQQVPLFGGTVQCASCHDPHDDTNAPFLVMSNSQSALCVKCHSK